mmetsp:Transcript_80358/g.215451  ORF Transcript_80358/g.215451 Transcript_80358/m.215451 type:complete len:91 (+) Transcript_80358:288-560(+)
MFRAFFAVISSLPVGSVVATVTSWYRLGNFIALIARRRGKFLGGSSPPKADASTSAFSFPVLVIFSLLGFLSLFSFRIFPRPLLATPGSS